MEQIGKKNVSYQYYWGYFCFGLNTLTCCYTVNLTVCLKDVGHLNAFTHLNWMLGAARCMKSSDICGVQSHKSNL